MEILIRRLVADVELPRYHHVGDAGLDLATTIDITLGPGERALVSTGIAVAIPEGYAAYVQPRSGLALHHGVTVLNSPGLVDSGYRGEIKVLLVNLDPALTHTISRGARIAQLVIHRIEMVNVKEVDQLPRVRAWTGRFRQHGQIDPAQDGSSHRSEGAAAPGNLVRMYFAALSGGRRTVPGPLRTKKSPPASASIPFHLRNTGSGLR